MRRTRHPATRLLGALTAFVTVWCLGCSAFDPLVEQLLGGTAMVCASQSGMSMGGEIRSASGNVEVSASTGTNELAPAAVSAAPEHVASGVSCGCLSCMAAASATTAAVSPNAPAPQAHLWLTPAPLELTRAPLVPPPERML